MGLFRAYALALAGRGIAAPCPDHCHYGEIGGDPRQYENYPHKIEDLKVGLKALASHEAIDAGRNATCPARSGIVSKVCTFLSDRGVYKYRGQRQAQGTDAREIAMSA